MLNIKYKRVSCGRYAEESECMCMKNGTAYETDYECLENVLILTECSFETQNYWFHKKMSLVLSVSRKIEFIMQRLGVNKYVMLYAHFSYVFFLALYMCTNAIAIQNRVGIFIVKLLQMN